ncbi:hypothetical protein [Flavobacterium sp.]|uniref:hypothetical protein n=1 Tax=Flavobacterium sp. TaxID=239 RepID=UPI004047E89C
MIKENIDKQLSEKSKSIYHDYGHFAIEFEQLTLSIKICIFSLMGLQGLKDFKYLRILLHDQTAFPLLNKLRSLLALHYEKEPERLKALDKLFSYTIKMIEKRNDIIHGSFFVTSESNGNLFKDKTGKFGVNPIEDNYDKTKFINYTTKLILAKNKFDVLNSYFYENDEVYFEIFNIKQLEQLDIDK